MVDKRRGVKRPHLEHGKAALRRDQAKQFEAVKAAPMEFVFGAAPSTAERDALKKEESGFGQHVMQRLLQRLINAVRRMLHKFMRISS